MSRKSWGFAAAGVIAVIIAALSVWLAPWWHAGTTPVVIRMDVPEGVQPAISWGDPDQATLPLIQVQPGTWTTELPPRPSYLLTLHLPGVDAAPQVHELALLQLDAPRRDLYRANPPAVGDPVLEGGMLKVPLTAQLERSALLGSSNLVPVALSLIAFLVIMGSCALAIFRINPDFKLQPDQGVRWRLPVCLGLLLLLGATLHVLIVASSGAIFWPADSIGYGQRAISLLERGSLDTGAVFHELSRPPGTPLLMAAAFWLLGHDLLNVAILHSVLYVAAVAWLIVVLQRSFPGWVWYVVGPLALLAPAPVMTNRVIASEAPFVIASLLTIACLLHARTSRHTFVWFALAGLGAGFGLITRLNACVLLTPALLFILASFWGYFRHRDWRLLWSHASPWLVFTLVALVPVLAYTARNASVLDYAKPTDLGALSRVEALYKSGTLDSSALLEAGIYDEVVTKRFESSYNFEGWGTAAILGRSIDPHVTPRGTPMKALDAQLNQLADANDRRTPLALRATAFLRSLSWTLWMYQDPNFQPFGPSTHIFYSLSEADVAYVDQIVKDWVSPKLSFYQADYGSIHQAWNWVLKHYRVFFRVLVTASLLVLVIQAIRGKAQALILLMPYFANLVLISLLGVAILRYTEPLMPLLLLSLPMLFATLSRNQAECGRCDGPRQRAG